MPWPCEPTGSRVGITVFERRLRRRNRIAGEAAAGDRWGVSAGEPEGA